MGHVSASPADLSLECRPAAVVDCLTYFSNQVERIEWTISLCQNAGFDSVYGRCWQWSSC
jgi:hypothetical protein